MGKSSCELLLDRYPRISEVEHLRSTYIANCVLNSFFTYTAIMLNIATIHAIRRPSSLPKTLRALLLSLAVSDVGVGLVGQPFYISLLITWLNENSPGCNTYMPFTNITSLLSIASFFGVVAISVDRFLAIHLHLRYQELVTHKRVVGVVISIWVLSAFISLAALWVPFEIYLLFKFIFGVLGLLITAMVYIRIYFAVRRHKNQIQALDVQQVPLNVEVANLMKSVVGIFYVYLVFLACYFPYLVSMAAIKFYGGSSIALKGFSFFSWTLMFVNSSLNPVIYCWKMRHIRHAIMGILRNIYWRRNRAKLSAGPAIFSLNSPHLQCCPD